MASARRSSRSLRGLRFTQRLIPIGRRIGPWLIERSSRAWVAFLFTRWPGLWGLEETGKRVLRARSAFERAFPDRDSERFVAAWTHARGEAMGTSLLFLARWLVGRSSRFIRPAPNLGLPENGPFVVAALHYSIDPAVQLSCISASSRRDLLWAVYPLQATVEDDRELWLAGSPVPDEVARLFTPVSDRRWIVDAAAHLRRGGGVFLAIDAPFDCGRPAEASIGVGEASIPLAPSVELFSRLGDVPLFFASPWRARGVGWTVHLTPVADLADLALAAERWISANQRDWAGWPHVLWRDDAEKMRAKLAARGSSGGAA